MDQFLREIVGALRSTINAHGPITEAQISSAAKRIAGALREPMKRERDRMMTTQPRGHNPNAEHERSILETEDEESLDSPSGAN